MSSPRGFGLPHLSEDAVAAFADGVLSAAAASRARRHCDECAECADAVRIQREAAMLLRAAQAPALPSGLLDRLAGLPMSAPLPPPRGGLPTVLGADGVPMFVAHDSRNDEQGRPGEQPTAAVQPQQSTRPTPRRGAVPVTVLASAAAVVAAGTFGGHVSTLAASSNLQAPAGAANAAGGLTAAPSTSRRSVGPLAGAGLLGAGGFSTGGAAIERAPAPQSGGLATSVSVAPVFRTGFRSSSPRVNRATSTGAPVTAGYRGASPSGAGTGNFGSPAGASGSAGPGPSVSPGNPAGPGAAATGGTAGSGTAGSGTAAAPGAVDDRTSAGPAPAARPHGPITATP